MRESGEISPSSVRLSYSKFINEIDCDLGLVISYSNSSKNFPIFIAIPIRTGFRFIFGDAKVTTVLLRATLF